MNVAGKQALVLGLGETGLSMAKWLSSRGARVRVADSRASPPNLAALKSVLPSAKVHLGSGRDRAFEGVDLIAISPGVPLADPAVRRAASRGVPVLGDVELFARALVAGTPGNSADIASARVIAITGTNGKSTVTALAGAMCRAAGLDCEVAGNISPAVLDALARREGERRMPQAWVLELSSYQLEATHSLAPVAAAMLNISEDHRDRYASMQDYAAAKARIFAGGGAQVLNRDDPGSLAMAIAGRRVVTFGLDAPADAHDFGVMAAGDGLWLAEGTTPLLAISAMKLAGMHNAANALAALALCRVLGLAQAPLLDALRAFRGLPHRVELIAEVNGVRYYDDSKGTNVGSTVAALAGLCGPGAAAGARVVLIAGGEGKGQDFTPLAAVVAAAARAVVLIGRDAARLDASLAHTGVPRAAAGSMEEAVAVAAAHARAGDAVLLSPACASFDMFRNFEHRGEVFRGAVQRLPHARPH